LCCIEQRGVLQEGAALTRVCLNGAHFPRARASDALRQQTDPLEPAGRRFANFFLESSF
jgi:hypothetical protein